MYLIDCHFSRGLRVTQSEAYQYYSQIEKYPERYPRYYKVLRVLDRSENSLKAKMFLEVNLSKKIEEVEVIVKYTFVPQSEIKYEIVKGIGEGIIKNSIVIKGQIQ